MPQPAHKVFLRALSKEAVAYSAAYERSKPANEKDGAHAEIRKAMKLLLMEKQSQDFYLGAFWGLRYALEIFGRCMARKQEIVVPGKPQTNPASRYTYSVGNMMGVAAVRAAESKKGKGE